MNARKCLLLRESHHNHLDSGFTIVELLVVIVVIGILAALTVVAYTGISQRAVVSSLQSDLSNSAQKLKLYQVDHSAYPATLDGSNCPTSPADTSYCMKPSSGTTFLYSSPSPYTSFILKATNGSLSYQITDSTVATMCTGLSAVVTGSPSTVTTSTTTTYTFTSPGTVTISGTCAAASVVISGGGGGSGGMYLLPTGGNGDPGTGSSMSIGANTYSAGGGSGGAGITWSGIGATGSIGTTNTNGLGSLSATPSGAGNGAPQNCDGSDCGGAGGAGGQITGTIMLNSGQTINIVSIGSGGWDGNSALGFEGSSGGVGLVTISYMH